MDTPWANYVRKLPGKPRRSASRLAAILISPPKHTPLLLICTYLPAGSDQLSLSRYNEIAADILTLSDAHPRAVTLVGGDELAFEGVQALADRVARRHAGVEALAIHGGQPLWPLIVGVE